MAIGARDFIDKLLVEKYSQEQVDNHTEEALTSRINADDIMSAMNAYSNNYRNYLDVSAKLNITCYSVNARNAKYVSIPA
jgi:hypothetical protein